MSIIKNTEELNNLLNAVQKLPVKKDEQEKVVDITENGTTVVTPDEGMTLSKVTVNVEVESGGGGTEEIEQIIDQSGVLDSIEGTIEEKIEYLIRQMRTVLEMKSVTFGMNGSTTERIDLNCKGIKSLNQAFYNCDMLTTVTLTNTQGVHGWQYAFYGSARITDIKTLNMSNADKDTIKTNWMCSAVVNLEFVPQTIKNTIGFGNCSKLSVESIQSIVDGLATVETAQTLTLHTDVKSKLTTEQLTTITNKNWSVA